jgi:hypothetical protein
VWEKAPYHALCVRAGLAWRTEELGRETINCIERRDCAAAALLARAILAGAGLLWALLEHLIEGDQLSAEELNEAILRLLMGHGKR